jgi:hypothetical protein
LNYSANQTYKSCWTQSVKENKKEKETKAMAGTWPARGRNGAKHGKETRPDSLGVPCFFLYRNRTSERSRTGKTRAAETRWLENLFRFFTLFFFLVLFFFDTLSKPKPLGRRSPKRKGREAGGENAACRRVLFGEFFFYPNQIKPAQHVN